MGTILLFACWLMVMNRLVKIWRSILQDWLITGKPKTVAGFIQQVQAGLILLKMIIITVRIQGFSTGKKDWEASLIQNLRRLNLITGISFLIIKFPG